MIDSGHVHNPGRRTGLEHVEQQIGEQDDVWLVGDGALESAVPNDLVVGKAIFIYASFDHANYFLPRFNRMFRPVR